MANEFKIKHGFVSTGNGTIEGEIRITGAAYADNNSRLATRAWATQFLADNNYLVSSDLPTNVSAFTNDAGYLTTVPAEYVTEGEGDARYAPLSHNHSYLPLSGGTLYKATNTTGTSGTTFLTVHNDVGGDISQQQSFIDFMFTDTNANFFPQVRIGAQVGRNADANAISKEGAGAFVVYTGDGTDESGGGALTEALRIGFDNKLYVQGEIQASGYNKTSWDTAFSWGNHAGLYADASHTHAYNTLTGIPSTFAPSAHTHSIDQVDGLQTELEGKQPVGDYLLTTGKAADSNLLDGINSTSFLRSDAADTFSGILTGTAAGENLKIGGIRGTAKGSQTGEYIHLYERVHIGGPNGWGASTHGAPAYGLSTWGSVDFGMNGTGVIQLDGTTIVTAARALTNVTNTNWDAAYGWGNHADSGYALNTRIDEEVLPAIPTNNNELINGAGYITDGNTGWNNTYGFITASDSITGNAATATKLATARNIALSGAVTGNANFDGSGNITIATTATSDPTLTLAGDASGSATFTNLGNATLTVTVANDSHTHDGRYYTESESDARFVNVTGDTITGDLLISGASLGVTSTAEGTEAFYVDGVNGRLFTISDDLSDSLFSVNTISGLPVIEAFADNTVKIGPFSNPVTIDSSGILSIGGVTAATQTYVDTAVSNLIGGAPGALDTLNELAAAINDDASFASSVTSSLALKAPLASPALTGTPTAPTAATATNTTQIATTAFVKAQGYVTTDTNYYLNGISRLGNVLTFSVAGATNQTYTFGSAAWAATTAFDSAGTGAAAAGVVNTRIDEEVIPAIDTKADANHNHTGVYLPIAGKAADSEKVDGINGASLLRSDAADNFSGTLTWNGAGGATALSLANANIVGVNQIEINDPGEGIIWTAGANGSITLATIDDAADNILNVSGTGASLAVNGARVATQDWVAAQGYITAAGANYYVDGLSFDTGNGILTASVNGTTNQTVDLDGRYALSSHSHSYLPLSGGTVTGTLTLTGSSGVSRLRIEGTTPTIDLDDSDGDSFYIHVNSNNFYVLVDRDGTGDYNTWEGPHPLQLEGDTNSAYIFGNKINSAAYAATTAFDAAGSASTAESNAITHADNRIDTEVLPQIQTPAITSNGSTPSLNTGITAAEVRSLIGAQAAGSYLTTTGKAADSNLLDGLDLHTGRNNEANKVVRTDSNGYIQAGWINTPSGAAGTINKIYCSQDDYVRYLTPANFRAQVTDGAYQPAGSYLTTSGKAADSNLLDGQDSTGFFRALPGIAGADKDSLTGNGFLSASYIGYSSQLWTVNASGSTGTVQMEFEYNTPSRGFKIRNKTDNNTWSSTGWVVMTTDNQGHISGTLWHSGNFNPASYQPAGTYNTIIGTDSDINTSGSTIIDNIYVTDGVITSMGTRTLTAADLGIAKPASPGFVAANIVGETVEVVFDQSGTAGIDSYQVWSSAAGGAYGLIANIPTQDIAATMTAIDAVFSVSGNQLYRIYAIKNGIYSDPAEGGVTYTASGLDVVNMSVVNLNTAYYIQYDMPDSRFVDHIEIYMDAEANSANLTRTGATLVYSGNNTSYMYQIGAADLDKFHQFWVEVVES